MDLKVIDQRAIDIEAEKRNEYLLERNKARANSWRFIADKILAMIDTLDPAYSNPEMFICLEKAARVFKIATEGERLEEGQPTRVVIDMPQSLKPGAVEISSGSNLPPPPPTLAQYNLIVTESERKEDEVMKEERENEGQDNGSQVSEDADRLQV